MSRRVLFLFLFLFLALIAVPVWAETLQPHDTASGSQSRGGQVANRTGNQESGEAPRICEEPPLPLEKVLAEIGESPEAVAAVSEIAAAVSRRLGHPISAEESAARIKDSRSVQELFSVRLPELVEGFAAGQTAVDAQGGAASENSFRLPKRVSLREAPRYFDAAPTEPQQLYGNLYRYAIPSGIAAEEVKMRSAFGEILDRLALNRSTAEEDRFSVVYRDTEHSDFDAFVDALLQSGHRIEMDLSSEVADFVHLMVRKPDGTLREVQTEVRIRTGYFTPEGTEIVIPAVHSHFIFRFAGPDVSTAVEFYQGTYGTHFYPSVVVKGESWVGIRTSATYGPDKAVKALKAAGLYLDLLQGISREGALFAGGYGQSGICNDSVAVIEMLLNGRATVYPLLIDKERVPGYLETVSRERPALTERYRQLRRAIEQVPSDVTPNLTQPRRILDSIPYEPGPTPYPGFNDARRTFGNRGPDGDPGQSATKREPCSDPTCGREALLVEPARATYTASTREIGFRRGFSFWPGKIAATTHLTRLRVS
jgi:hypothetical protein